MMKKEHAAKRMKGDWNMAILYEATGAVNSGFQGTISYTVYVPSTLTALQIDFSFQKQRLHEIGSKRKEEVTATFRRRFGIEDMPEDEVIRAAQGMKTEIQLAAFLGGEFIGGIHRQMAERTMRITADEATEGAIPQAELSGVLRVEVIFFHVLYNETNYTLTVSGEGGEPIGLQTN